MDWTITQHAIEQYIRRYDNTLTYGHAHTRLMELLNSSTSDGRTEQGSQIYLSGLMPECRLVIKDRNVLITVLPKKKDHAEEIEFIREAYEAELRLKQAVMITDKVITSVGEALPDIEDLKKQILAVESEKAEIDRQRLELGKKKHEISNRLDGLKRLLQYTESLQCTR